MQTTQFWRALPLLILAHVLQTTWLAHVRFFDVSLDLPLLVAISISLCGGAYLGAWTGFGAGLLTGVSAGIHLGSFIISRTVSAGAVGFSPRFLSPDNPLTPPVCAGVAAFLADFIMMIMAPTGETLSWRLHHALFSMVLQAVLIWPVYLLVRRAVLPPPKPMFTSNIITPARQRGR